MNMRDLRELLKTPRVRIGLAVIALTITIVISFTNTALFFDPLTVADSLFFDPLTVADAPFPNPTPDGPMMQQRPDLEPLIRNAVRSALNEALDTKLNQQTDRVLGGIYAAAGFLAAFMALIAAGVWKLHGTMIRQATALGTIQGFLQAAFPNITDPGQPRTQNGP